MPNSSTGRIPACVKVQTMMKARNETVYAVERLQDGDASRRNGAWRQACLRGEDGEPWGML